MHRKSFFLGLLLGGAAASMTALLNAPTSGKEARQYVKELNTELSKLNQSIIHASKEGKDKLMEYTQDISTSVQQWKSDILPHQEKLQQEIKSIEQSIEQLEAELNRVQHK